MHAVGHRAVLLLVHRVQWFGVLGPDVLKIVLRNGEGSVNHRVQRASAVSPLPRRDVAVGCVYCLCLRDVFT